MSRTTRTSGLWTRVESFASLSFLENNPEIVCIYLASLLQLCTDVLKCGNVSFTLATTEVVVVVKSVVLEVVVNLGELEQTPDISHVHCPTMRRLYKTSAWAGVLSACSPKSAMNARCQETWSSCFRRLPESLRADQWPSALRHNESQVSCFVQVFPTHLMAHAVEDDGGCAAQHP